MGNHQDYSKEAWGMCNSLYESKVNRNMGAKGTDAGE